MPTTAEQLQAAYRLVREGRAPEAQQLLLPVVRNDAGNADAWWLLANAFGDTPKAVYALQQVLALRPDDERARRMLDRLRGAGISPQSPFDGWTGSSGSSPVESTPVQDMFSSTSSSFGSSGSAPVGGFGTSSSPDPFGYSQASEKPKNDFGTYTPVSAPPVYAQPPRRGSSPCMVVLAFIGFLTLVACGLCGVVFATGGGALGSAIQQAVGTLQADPDLAQAFSALATQGVNFNLNGTPFSFNSSSFSSNRLPSNVPSSATRRSEITYGSTETGRLANGAQVTYTFNGTQGDVVTISYDSASSSAAFDPLMALYGPNNIKLAEDDDGGDNRNSLISSYSLPSTGKYTILLGSFASTGGDYILSIHTAGQ
ncbi:MAG: hypothetical protein U0670_13265 [Anaerolineae bacterium]